MVWGLFAKQLKSVRFRHSPFKEKIFHRFLGIYKLIHGYVSTDRFNPRRKSMKRYPVFKRVPVIKKCFHVCRFCFKCFKNKSSRSKYCSKKCNYDDKRKKKEIKCVCGKLTFNKRFCSFKCFDINHRNNADKRYKLYIERWLIGEESGNKGEEATSDRIRRWLFERACNKCEKCGWNKVNEITGKIPLTINHKDGNCKNNSPENLELICPNCHSLTSNYGNLNKGNGRKNRIEKIRKCKI